MTPTRGRSLVLALLLVGCAAPEPPPAAAQDGGPIVVSDSDGKCFTIERAPSADGGLAIARQRVCSIVTPRSAD